jgi:hypothetical protein
MEIKKSMFALIYCFIITLYLTLFQNKEINFNLTESFINNDSYCIREYCPYVALNLSNPKSYINTVTRPFLIELVKKRYKSK